MTPKPLSFDGAMDFGRELEQWLKEKAPPGDAVVAAMIVIIGNILAQNAPNESDLLDGIKMTNDALRATATTLWVERRRRR
jgi:hypothetical protein